MTDLTSYLRTVRERLANADTIAHTPCGCDHSKWIADCAHLLALVEAGQEIMTAIKDAVFAMEFAGQVMREHGGDMSPAFKANCEAALTHYHAAVQEATHERR